MPPHVNQINRPRTEGAGESEERYRHIVDTACEGIWVLDADYVATFVNKRMADMLGYEPEDIVGQRHDFFMFPEDLSDLEEKASRRRQGIAEEYERRFRHKDGSTLWVHASASPILDGEGRFQGSFAMFTDITEARRVEQALLESEAKYRSIFDNAPEGIFQSTPDGRYLSANPALARIHGFSSPREMVESVTDIAHQLYVDPSRRAELKRLMEKEGVARNFEIMMRRKDLSLHWVSVTSRAIRDASGAVLYYEGTLEDITSRKFAEEGLRELKNTLAGALGAMSSLVETREPGIAGHHKRVSAIAGAVAGEMGFAANTIESIRTAGIIHDVGKISIPVEILSKPTELSEAEYNLVKSHPRFGYTLLKDSQLPYPVAQIIHQHHERFNGSGYPLGLKGKEILLEARILAVADVVEAITSSRPYRPAHSIDAALDELRRNRAILYDAEAVDACLRLFKKGYVHQ
jgi:PAS domain S-box-containing protein/putative nucleotidyltransferase with HDIG domain